MAQVQILYVATDDGLIQLANPGNVGRWRQVDTALKGQRVLAIRASAADPLQALAGSDLGLYGTADGGASWNPEHSAVVTALAATEDAAVYAGTNTGVILQRQVTGWAEVYTGRAPVVHLNPLADGRVAAVYANGSIAFLLAGVWSLGESLASHPMEVVSSVAQPDRLYISDRTGLVTPLGTRSISGEPTGAIVLLAGKPEVVLVGTKGLVQRSDDDAATLVQVEGPSDVRVLVSPPHFQDHVYAGTGFGELWASRDRGRSWERLKDSMAAVNDLSFARVQ